MQGAFASVSAYDDDAARERCDQQTGRPGIVNLASTGSLETDAAGSRAFEAIFEAEQRRLFSIALSILRDPADAQDAVQETGLLGWRRWRSLHDESKSAAWLARICVNLCLDRRRRLVRRMFVDDAARELRETADAHLTDGGRYIDIHRAYTKLSIRQRAVITLHYQHGYTLTECAELMGCSAGSVSQHLARGLKRLRRELVDE
jgi:RNA polymerase sigma-70 factor (ECF subfamily)